LKISLVINPVSGSNSSRLVKNIKNLIRRYASSAEVIITGKKGDAAAFSRELFGTDLIIVAGGDGTLNEVINGVLSRQKSEQAGKTAPLALIPLGTTNVMAKELGIPEEAEKAVHLAFNGAPKKISLGRINGHFFSLMVGIGFDGEAVSRAKNNIKKISGKGAYIYSGINALINYNPALIEVKTMDGVFTGHNAVIGNAHYYGGYFQVTPRANLTEPLLDLCLYKGDTRRDFLRFISGVLRKKHLGFKDVIYGKFSELEITSKGTVHVQADGDYFGILPVKIESVKDAISLIC
jgi:YegS/Rv2252/BmrU family lipid kinase